MAYSTYTAFVGALADLSIAGINRVYDQPPAQISTANLPAMYPRLPDQSREVISLSGADGLAAGICELVVLIEPVAQNTNAGNYAAMLALVDAIDTALSAQTIAIGIDRWDIRQETAVFGDTQYWALVATVEASG